MSSYQWPAFTAGTVSLASVGTNGSTAPTSSDQIGVVDGSGNLQPVTQGQAAMAASLPVVIANNQSAVPVSQSGTWNVTNVSGTVSLPTGAATSAKQDTGNTSVASIDTKTPALGQAAMSASRPVTIASDQALSTGMIRTATGNLTATSQAVTIATSGAQVILCMPTGTFSATVTFESTGDAGTTWQSIQAWDYSNTSFSNTANVSGRIYAIPALGNTIRARCSTYASGTMVVNLVATVGAFPAMYVSPVTFFPIQGATAAGSTATGTQPVLGGAIFQTSPATITNGQQGFLQCDNVQNLLTKINVALPTGTNSIGTVVPAASSTATTSTVASSASSVQLLASTAGRKQATFYNDSTQIAYLKLGTTASTTDYTVQLASGAYYELPSPQVYTGRIDAIWAAANGNMRITELT